MSGFQHGGPPFGPPYNYGGQYMPQFQGGMPFNNGMMPQQPLQHPPFQQHRPPPFSQMPQAPNQVHFPNGVPFHNNQYPPPAFPQGQPPPPHFFNYNQYSNNMSGPPFTSNMNAHGFTGGPSAPLSQGAPAIPSPHVMNPMPHTGPAATTPIRSTFTPQRPPMSHSLDGWEGGENVISIVPTPTNHMQSSVPENSTIDSQPEPDTAKVIQKVGISGQHVQQEQALEAVDTVRPVEDQTMQMESITIDRRGSAEQQRQRDDEGTLPAGKSAPQTPSDSSKEENFYGTDFVEQKASAEPPMMDAVQRDSESRANDALRAVKRGQAKQALKDLSEKKIGFDIISTEQLNLDFLRQLYLESGLPVSAALPSKPAEKPLSQVNGGGLATALEPERNPMVGESQPDGFHVQDTSQKTQAPSAQQAEPASSVVVLPENSSPKRTPDPIKPPISKTPRKPTPTKTADQPKGRQDYIARLLAAKAGIKQDPREQGKPSEPPSDLVAKAPIQVEEIIEPVPKKQASSEIKKPETKDSKQTELIRQRLEALKNSSRVQKPPHTQSPQQVQPKAAPTLKSVSSVSGMETDQTPAIQPGVIDVARANNTASSYDSSASFFATAYQSPLGGLPGLPGLSGSPITSTQTPAQQRDSIDENLSEDGEILSEDEHYDDEAYNLRTKHQDQQTSASITPPEPPRTREASARETPPLVGSRKRPTAADFIDSPPHKVMKRPASSDPIHLVIEVSDNEDETRGPSARDPDFQDGRPSNTPQTRDDNLHDRRGLRELPPLSDFPMRNTPLGKTPRVQTPSLAQHEEEIRLIKLKIAEAESRRKSKKPSETPAAVDSVQPLPNVDSALLKAIDTKQATIKQVNEALEQQEQAVTAEKQKFEERLEVDRQNQARVTELAEQERRGAARATTLAEREARLKRKAALEAALPNLDAQIEAARTKLDNVTRQQEEIRAELQRGNEGRTALINELGELLKALEAEEIVEDLFAERTADTNMPQPPTDLPSPSPHPKEASPEPTPMPPKIIIPDRAVEPRGAIPTPQTAQTSGEVMDISSSSEDEGQIIESLRESSSRSEARQSNGRGNEGGYEPHYLASEKSPDYEPAVAATLDTESGQLNGTAPRFLERDTGREIEDYEPSLEVEVISPSSAMEQSPSSRSHSEIDEDVVSSASGLPPSYQGNAESVSKSTGGQTPASQSSLPEEGEISDDYEPPEASYPVESQITGAAGSPTNVAHVDPLQDLQAVDLDAESPSPQDAASNPIVDLTEDTGAETSKAAISVPTSGSFTHFTPYESPLRQFSSYRFHPQYVEQVAGGFHSLTFNHKISPTETLCRWELAGGICNDSSCEYQHFRDLPLTDNNLLLQLGSVHEGATKDEKEAYVTGLKLMIAGMRDKNLRDITAIASEIVAYRSRFLSNPSRVLTNI